MDHSTSSGDEDIGRASSSSHLREGNNDGRQNNRHHYHNYHNSRDRDYDTRSQSSQKSDPNSETSGRGDATQYNLSTFESVESQGSGGGGDSRGFPLHGHVHFRHPAMNANHLLNGDPAHQFPPSLYQSSADAPKSDTATVCSSSMLEDIEDVGSHYDGECSQTSSSKQHDHQYAPPSGLRRSNSKEGNTLVDFAERSQAVFPKQSKSSGPGHAAGISQEASLPNNDEDAPGGNGMQHRKGMGPPLSRHWLLQHHGNSPFGTGSVKSGGSNTGSDVFVNVGSDCGGSLTDMQSVLSQEDAALLTTANFENSGETPSITASVALAAKMDALDTSSNASITTATEEEDEKKPHPLMCDQSGSKTSGRISPGGTIYRGRGVRRYKGRFYALPLKRFHQDGVHLHSDSEPEGSITGNDNLHQFHNQERQRHEDGDNYRWEDRDGGNFRNDYQRGGDNHNYDDHSSSRHKRDYNRDRNRSRSRSRSPHTGDRRREDRNRNLDQARGYKIDKNAAL
jgi:hypothetical protein